MEAYILINAEPGMIWEVADATRKIEGVQMAHAVTGQFDAVVYVEFVKMEDLGRIIEKIQHLKGVRRNPDFNSRSTDNQKISLWFKKNLS